MTRRSSGEEWKGLEFLFRNSHWRQGQLCKMLPRLKVLSDNCLCLLVSSCSFHTFNDNYKYENDVSQSNGIKKIFIFALTQLSFCFGPGRFTSAQNHHSFHHFLNQCGWSAVWFNLSHVLLVKWLQSFRGFCQRRQSFIKIMLSVLCHNSTFVLFFGDFLTPGLYNLIKLSNDHRVSERSLLGRLYLLRANQGKIIPLKYPQLSIPQLKLKLTSFQSSHKSIDSERLLVLDLLGLGIQIKVTKNTSQLPSIIVKYM